MTIKHKIMASRQNLWYSSSLANLWSVRMQTPDQIFMSAQHLLFCSGFICYAREHQGRSGGETW